MKLKKIIFPSKQEGYNGVTTIGTISFANTSIRSIDLTQTSINTLSNGLFEVSANLTSVKLNSSITSIGGLTFKDATNFNQFLYDNIVDLNGATTTSGTLLFATNLNMIDDKAFENCIKIQTVDLSLVQNMTYTNTTDGLTNVSRLLNDFAFMKYDELADQSELTTVYLPKVWSDFENNCQC